MPIQRLHTAVIALLLMIASCDEPGKRSGDGGSTDGIRTEVHTQTTKGEDTHAAPISQYIRRMLQEPDGTMWFGTTGDGVVRYAGHELTYFDRSQGLGGDWVSSMVQDANGTLWFGTGGGVSRYDGSGFITYTTKDGLPSDQVWCLLLDRTGVLWAGTEEGAARFNGRTFDPFPIPAADLNKFPYYNYPKQINWMIQDRRGHIWFATNGGGAYSYNGVKLMNISEKEGLCNNFVQTMLEDRSGNIWFGTRYGGACKFDPIKGGAAITTYTREQLKGDDVWTMLETVDGALWLAVTRIGLCVAVADTFTCYEEQDGEGVRVVQSLLEDDLGRLWVGTSAGVYHYHNGRFTPWSKDDARSGVMGF